MSDGPEVPPELTGLIGQLHSERYRVTVYVAPDIDRDWLASQLPADVEVVTHKYLTEGTAIITPTMKRFIDLPSVPPTTTTVGEAEEPDDKDDGGHDPQQRGHGEADAEEEDNEQKDKQQQQHGGLLST